MTKTWIASMRLSLLVCVVLFASTAPGAPAFARARAPHQFHSPTHCPELRVEGFCPYDSGWQPRTDNPLFSPLRPEDTAGLSAPICWASDSRRRILLSYETENPAPVIRIGGRLVHFRPAGADSVGRFIAPEGRLTIREGAVVAREHESEASRATLTFVDRGGRAHTASVRFGCGV
jgi:hypothetical protein